MIKVIFVLVLMNTQGGINADLQFPTLQQCEQVKSTLTAIKPNNSTYQFIAGECVEQQVKSKKLKCSIENKTDYQSTRAGAYNQNMEHYPYPVGFICVED